MTQSAAYEEITIDTSALSLFDRQGVGFPITDSNILLTQQDIQDIIAFLKLL